MATKTFYEQFRSNLNFVPGQKKEKESYICFKLMSATTKNQLILTVVSNVYMELDTTSGKLLNFSASASSVKNKTFFTELLHV